MKIYLKTYGCKVNQYESEKIRFNLKLNGYEIVNSYEKADIIIVNTCIVTEKSEKKNRDLIKKIKQEHPNTKVMGIGCLIEKEEINETDISIDNDKKVEKVLNYFGISCKKNLSEYDKQTRGFIKIQDGCNQYCSYCIIPYLRGNERDYEFNSILDEAEDLANNGFKEIVLTGIHLGKFKRLNELIKKMSENCRIKRIRLSSIQINEISDELIHHMKYNDKFMPHLHLSLQSGSNKILDKMNRPYTRDYFLNKVKTIQNEIPDVGITTDIIVGFPTETEKDFQDTLDVLKKLNIHRVHVFPYSKRKGTEAYSMKNHVEDSVKKTRAREARKIASKSFKKFVDNLEESYLKVLVESNKNEASYGYSENYLRCKIENDIINSNEITEVKVIDKVPDKNLVITKKI